jgi:hypothetical protein
VPFPIIWWIDVERGRREGKAMAEELGAAEDHSQLVEDEEESTRLMS